MKVALKIFTRILLVLMAAPLILTGFLAAALIYAVLLGSELFDEYLRP